MLAIVLGLALVAVPAYAGPNPDAALAMHTVASFEYLYCPELTVFNPDNPQYFPIDCSQIDNSAEMTELDASYGYVYVVFIAYNINALSGVEYCIAGWPASRGAPPAPPLSYCPETSLVLGDPFAGGGVQAFGQSVYPYIDCGGTIGFAYFVWGAFAYSSYLPLTLDYCASAYSYPTSPHNYVLGIAPDFVEDPTTSEFGCTIGGVYPVVVPYEDCEPTGTPTERTTWSKVKSRYKK
jgi:hypothetical protein